MTQVADAMSGVAGYVAISTDGNSWTDVSGYANYVEPDPQARTSGETYTFDGDTGIVTFGKREPIEVMVRIVYSEGASSPYDTLRTAHETAGGGRMQVRWAPKGSTAGNQQFSTGSDSKISEFPYPAPDAGSADPILLEFKVKTASIAVADISS